MGPYTGCTSSSEEDSSRGLLRLRDRDLGFDVPRIASLLFSVLDFARVGESAFFRDFAFAGGGDSDGGSDGDDRARLRLLFSFAAGFLSFNFLSLAGGDHGDDGLGELGAFFPLAFLPPLVLTLRSESSLRPLRLPSSCLRLLLAGRCAAAAAAAAAASLRLLSSSARRGELFTDASGDDEGDLPISTV